MGGNEKENGRKMGQDPHFSHSIPPPPRSSTVPFMVVKSPHSRLEKWGILCWVQAMARRRSPLTTRHLRNLSE